MPMLCRDCGRSGTADQVPAATGRCPDCGSPRCLAHPELLELAIAHIDCDAFYASVEKRDNPALENRPVIVGGGRRGVVAACCYIARLKGVHSAMPMYRARKACPDAVIIRPEMAKYQQVGHQIRDLMRDTTPLVEPLSIDEAFLDLSGTEKLHGGCPAATLIKLVQRIEQEIGVTASVGLSYNKFLAKTASDLDKPRGFAVIGRAEAIEFLSARPVGSIWGVGNALRNRLERDGLTTVGQLRHLAEADLVARYGAIGKRLAQLSQGLDSRRVDPESKAKSISAETTFSKDIKSFQALARRLWPLCEKVSQRLKKQHLAAGSITLKLKSSQFRQITRSHRLTGSTQVAEIIYRAALPMLKKAATGTPYRLIGIGTAQFTLPGEADLPDLLDDGAENLARIEQAMDQVRQKFGSPAIKKGRAMLED